MKIPSLFTRLRFIPSEFLSQFNWRIMQINANRYDVSSRFGSINAYYSTLLPIAFRHNDQDLSVWLDFASFSASCQIPYYTYNRVNYSRILNDRLNYLDSKSTTCHAKFAINLHDIFDKYIIIYENTGFREPNFNFCCWLISLSICIFQS